MDKGLRSLCGAGKVGRGPGAGGEVVGAVPKRESVAGSRRTPGSCNVKKGMEAGGGVGSEDAHARVVAALRPCPHPLLPPTQQL